MVDELTIEEDVINVSIYLTIYLSIYPSNHLSINLFLASLPVPGFVIEMVDELTIEEDVIDQEGKPKGDLFVTFVSFLTFL